MPSIELLNEDINQLPEMVDELNRALSEMRGFDYDNAVTPNLDVSKNELMKKRLMRKHTAEEKELEKTIIEEKKGE